MVRDGFTRQRLAVLPRPLALEAAALPLTGALQVTDAGWFPRAAGHQRSREHGSAESILLLCTEGSGWVELAGVRQEVRAPAVALIPAGAPHRYGASTGTPWTIWWLHLRGSLSAELFAEAGVGVTGLADAGQGAELAALAEQIVTALERDPSRAHLVRASGLAWNLLTLLASRTGEAGGDDPVQRTMGYLAERLDRPVGVEELARHARVSPSHLGALFRAATGGGVIAYHSTLRMARARQLLDGTDLPIAAVARATGYADPLYFSRQFSATHGVSPRGYRAQHKG
ncbi:helix-turn-helix domain-containing protein [Microterricola viridarii]|uniref:AraC-type DNA-binding protein n=1 Tax=Microterricola viridarii TaxID=412690 RepID=A0A1H1N2F8_9MICO|nr:helix-turn-helix domain-containing protein [Microterricola viridarii]SDR93164.1 AraC-type DNA-binding protein [Microterricola viridarii]